MKVKEVELGGVFNLDKYENVRISVRAEVEEGVGEALEQLSKLVEDLAVVQKVIRRWKDIFEYLTREEKSLEESIKRAEEQAVEWLMRAEKEARKHLEKLNLSLFPEEVRKKVAEDPVNVFRLGLVSTECAYLRDHEEFRKRAEKLREELKQLQSRKADATSKYSTMRMLIKTGKIEEAAEMARDLWQLYEELQEKHVW